jgi:hypothetical protein
MQVSAAGQRLLILNSTLTFTDITMSIFRLAEYNQLTTPPILLIIIIIKIDSNAQRKNSHINQHNFSCHCSSWFVLPAVKLNFHRLLLKIHENCLRYWEGVVQVCFLKIVLKADFGLKPESKAIAIRLYISDSLSANLCLTSSTL